MCGIFGYLGTKQAAGSIRQGLENLEYRGYDSWGIAVSNGASIEIVKAVGSVPRQLAKAQALVGQAGLGHTRWATNGGVTTKNAHPHRANSGQFALVHNGIVENEDLLRVDLLDRGWQFISQTDSEVIVHLLEEALEQIDHLVAAVTQVAKLIEGRNTFAVLTKDGQLVASKDGSPLVVGRSKDKEELFLSSDTASLVGFASEYVPLEDDEVVDLSKIELQKPTWEKLSLRGSANKLTDKHYMIQEIKEIPAVLRTLSNQSVTQYKQVVTLIKQAQQVYVIGSGSTGIAASAIAQSLRRYGDIEARGLVGAEVGSYSSFFDKHSLIIAPSQSGETADVLEVLQVAKKQGAKLVTFVNMPGSSMARMADISCMAESGPEKCVMSTKVFVAQVAWGYLLAQTVAGQGERARKHLRVCAQRLQTELLDPTWHAQIKKLAKSLLQTDDIYLLGTGELLPVAQEGMVKLIEGSYKHAHALPAGDLKHYAITLMETGVPVILLDTAGDDRQAVLTAAKEVKARGAHTIGIGPDPDESYDQYLIAADCGELQSVSSVVVLQLLSYYLTSMLGLPVDKPRNIAKSVTVK